MRNLINWIFRNKKFLIDYSVNFYLYKDHVKNDIKWAKSKDELITAISGEYKVKQSRIEHISVIELPPFSKAIKYINEDKNYL